LHADGGGWLAVQARGKLVFLAADFYPRHVADANGGTVRIGLEHDVGELRRGGKLALDQDSRRNFLGLGARQITNTASGNLGVLRADRVVDVGRGQVETDQLLRVDPDAHGPFGAVQLRLAHAVQALEFVHYVAREVIAERYVIELAVTGGQGHQQQETRGDFFYLQALLGHRLGQAWLHGLEPVLHIDLGHFWVGAGLEGGGDGGRTQAALGFEVQQVIGAVKLLLDQADHAFIQGLGRGAGVHRVDLDFRRRHVGVLGHRQLRDGQ